MTHDDARHPAASDASDPSAAPVAPAVPAASEGARYPADPAAPSDRYTRGLAALAQVAGTAHPTAALDAVAEIAPDLARITVEFGYGDVWSRPGLTPRQRQIGTIAALAALGNAAPQLRFHIAGALNVGCTRREIVETFIHASVYAGFPAALNALTAAREVFVERGGDDAGLAGPEQPAEPPADRYEAGLAALRDVDGPAGIAVVRSLDDIAPDLGRYLVEFVFGDVYTRPGLDLPTRELATVAMCTALGTAAPQLRIHLRAFLNVGGSRTEIVELLIQMAGYAGFPAALNALAAAREVFAEHE